MMTNAFKCDEYSAEFVECMALLYHKRTHTGGKPYECGECGKKFALKSGLKRHESIHSEEKSYSCPLCSATFGLVMLSPDTCARSIAAKKRYATMNARENFSLNRISCCIEKFTGEEIRTAHCSASFMRSHHLTQHLKVHTGKDM